jgi:Cu(I)/Ag(I) efflux system membrane protein CusA/SilA
VPVLMVAFIRGRILPEAKNPLNRVLIWLCRPVIGAVLRAPLLTILLAVLALVATAWPVSKLGSEFMPDLNEGTILYMPVTNPGLSITKAGELLQIEDRVLKSFPEVASVFGKAGRAHTATDPAPVEMFETVVNLKPPEQWRPGMTIEAHCRDGSGAAPARRDQHLDDADQGAHRHAFDRYSHAGRGQYSAPTSPASSAWPKRSRRVKTFRAPAAPIPRSGRALSGNRARPQCDRAMASRSPMSRRWATALGGEIVTAVEGRERYGVIVATRAIARQPASDRRRCAGLGRQRQGRSASSPASG